MRQLGLYQAPRRDTASVKALVEAELSLWSKKNRALAHSPPRTAWRAR